MKKAKYLISLIFLVHFVVFASSPISYTLTDDNQARHGITSEKENIHSPFFNIVILQLVYSNFHEHAAQDDDEDGFLLIKKKRAVLRANTLAKLLSLRTVSSAEDTLFPSVRPMDRSFLPPDDQKTCSGFLPSFSGLSPPLS
ncbi:MAG: hypothetical protein HZA17_10025 [Nitrospirae bacterium]|nr:hypothetical protein [Nitrospirota bacterium]